MIRLVLYLLAITAAALGLAWLAERPGNLVLTWQGYDIETTVFRAVVILALVVGAAILVASIIRQLWTSPATVGRIITQRRQEKGLDAISSGLIAIGAGDRMLATRYAVQARKALPNEPLTHLLRAQAAQLSGDRSTSRRIFEAMLASPDTEQLGLRGLYLEAEKEGEREAARQFAERALRLNPKLAWPVDALFDEQARGRDWDGALETLAAAKKHGHLEKSVADRRRAVLLTAKAQEGEESSDPKAMDMAVEAHNLAPDLVPAAVIAGRMLAARGSMPKAAKIIERTWRASPHPDLATVYAYVRPGDSPRDRLERLRRLARLAPHSVEGPIAIATAAIEGRDWVEARSVLEPLLAERLSQRVCTLMAKLEGGEHGDTGRVREWLARAVNAPRDPAWTADGVVAERWDAISPVTGALDRFEWKVPPAVRSLATDEAMAKMEELVALGTAEGPVLPPAEAREGASGDVEPGVDEPRSSSATSAEASRKQSQPRYYTPPVQPGRRSPAAQSEDSIEVAISQNETPRTDPIVDHDARKRQTEASPRTRVAEPASPVIIIGRDSAASAGDPSRPNGGHAGTMAHRPVVDEQSSKGTGSTRVTDTASVAPSSPMTAGAANGTNGSHGKSRPSGASAGEGRSDDGTTPVKPVAASSETPRTEPRGLASSPVDKR